MLLLFSYTSPPPRLIAMAAAAADFYAVLGLTRDCSDAELRIAYKKLALRWHPDRCSEKSKEEAKIRFQAIQEAYSVLSDSNKRLMYDIGVYDNSDDDEEGMEDFLGEMAEMMSQTKPNESFEELQRLFVEMFQADLDAGFGVADDGWNCTGSSTSTTVPLSYCSNKRGSSAVNSVDEFDSGTGAFCFGSTNPVREASSKGRMSGGNSSSSKSNKRRNGRKQKDSSSKHHVSSYDNTLVH